MFGWNSKHIFLVTLLKFYSEFYKDKDNAFSLLTYFFLLKKMSKV
jgi:hypothetical protein